MLRLGLFKKSSQKKVPKEVKANIDNLKRRRDEAEKNGDLKECDRLTQRVVDEDLKAGIL
jgi:hypothetical protein